MRKTITILICALTAATAAAQGFYYQSTMPDGRVIIGDKPTPGAKETKQIPLRQGNLSAPLVTPPTPAADTNGGNAREGRARRESSGQQKAPQGGKSGDTMADAQDALKKAQAALDAAKEPLPGEREGTAGGKSRLSDAYFQRIKGLEDAVSDAQKRVDDARRSELR